MEASAHRGLLSIGKSVHLQVGWRRSHLPLAVSGFEWLNADCWTAQGLKIDTRLCPFSKNTQ